MSKSKREMLETARMVECLRSAGVSEDDAWTLRRISMTLHRWHELECGNSDAWGSWAIERDDNGDGPPHMRMDYRVGCTNEWKRRRVRIPDREKGARKRLKAVLARYPGLSAYVQGDPRGCALYILRPGDVPEGQDVGAFYSRGIVVHE